MAVKREQYPHEGSRYIKASSNNGYNDLFKIYSLTYNIPFYFLPYEFKMTENLSPSWNNQSVIGRMDPIMTFKNMTRSIQVQFKARQKFSDVMANPSFFYLEQDELLHSIDHLKKCLYPRYDNNSVMISPPLFRFQYKNLINAGEEQFEIAPTNGVLGIVTAFAANFQTEPNKIWFPEKQSFAYPKVFDINFTFTVMNENLVSTQQNTILNKKYFYNYIHEHHNGGNDSAKIINYANTVPSSVSAPDVLPTSTVQNYDPLADPITSKAFEAINQRITNDNVEKRLNERLQRQEGATSTNLQTQATAADILNSNDAPQGGIARRGAAIPF